jgi:prepilin-type N-terminal cleavage/methylation domain-containing protein
MRARAIGSGLAVEAGVREIVPGESCGIHRRAGGPRSRRSDEDGFTLVELLIGMMLLVVLLGLGIFALRQFWLNHSLRGARTEVVTQLRQLQQRSVSESHPLVYGARFRASSSTFGLVKFNPHDTATTADDTCSEMSTVTLGSGVRVTSATFTSASGITSLCRSQIAGATSDEFVFFYARGTATEGNLTLEVPALPGRSLSVGVTPITGRVSEL